MAAVKYKTTVYKKATFRRTFKMFQDEARTVPLSLTGYHARFVAVEQVTRNGTAVLLFNLSTATADPGITVDTVNNQVIIELTPTQTDAITDDAIEISLDLTDPAGRVIPAIEGKWSIKERAASLV